MMKRIFISFFFLSFSLCVLAQSTLEKSYSLSNNEKLNLDFEYPELIKINTWDKQEVQIKARVLINGLENHEDFKLEEKRTAKGLVVSSKLNNLDKYKNNYITVNENDDEDSETVMISRNGTTITLGKGKGTYHSGTQIEIELEITLPKNAIVEVNAKYGMVEVLSLPREIEVYAKYGGADVKISEPELKALKASTSWGQIFSNMPNKFSLKGDDMMGRRMWAEFEDTKGSESIQVESEYGNIFLRKN